MSIMVINMEEFRDISGYEGLYQISNFGRVRSVDRVVTYSNGTSRVHKGMVRKPSVCEYNMIVLSKNGKLKTKKISRLVASHFIDNPMKLRVVNHIDGNKHNDKVDNLEWCTTSMNNIHAFDNGLSKRVNKTPGVFFDSRRGKWASYLYRNNKNIFCGRFLTEVEAIEARERKLDDTENQAAIGK